MALIARGAQLKMAEIVADRQVQVSAEVLVVVRRSADSAPKLTVRTAPTDPAVKPTFYGEAHAEIVSKRWAMLCLCWKRRMDHPLKTGHWKTSGSHLRRERSACCGIEHYINRDEVIRGSDMVCGLGNQAAAPRPTKRWRWR